MKIEATFDRVHWDPAGNSSSLLTLDDGQTPAESFVIRPRDEVFYWTKAVSWGLTIELSNGKVTLRHAPL